MAQNDVIYVDENEEERLNVKFERKLHNVYSLDGDLLSTEEKDWITISSPGDKHNVIIELVDEGHKRRFARKWASYQGMQDARITGTPIQSWEGLAEGQKTVFEQNGFNTIEQVALASENAFIHMQGGYSWKAKAQAYLSRTKVSESEKIRQQQDEIDQLKAQMAQLLNTKKAG